MTKDVTLKAIENPTVTGTSGIYEDVAKSADRKLSTMMKWASTGLATLLVVVLVWKGLLPFLDDLRAEAKLDNAAQRTREAQTAQALAETSTLNMKLMAVVEKQTEISARNATTSERTLDVLESIKDLQREIRDDQRRGAWRDDTASSKKPASTTTAKSKP